MVSEFFFIEVGAYKSEKCSKICHKKGEIKQTQKQQVMFKFKMKFLRSLSPEVSLGLTKAPLPLK